MGLFLHHQNLEFYHILFTQLIFLVKTTHFLIGYSKSNLIQSLNDIIFLPFNYHI